MATATPSPTPNPNAMKFTLDTKLRSMVNFASAEEAAEEPFAAAIFAAGGVASVFRLRYQSSACSGLLPPTSRRMRW